MNDKFETLREDIVGLQEETAEALAEDLGDGPEDDRPDRAAADGGDECITGTPVHIPGPQ